VMLVRWGVWGKRGDNICMGAFSCVFDVRISNRKFSGRVVEEFGREGGGNGCGIAQYLVISLERKKTYIPIS